MARRDEDEIDQPWLAEGVREERSTMVPRARLFGGGLIAVLLAVLVGIGVYLASGHKSDGSAGYARPEDAPLITADAGAYKVAPTDPGGAQITGIDDSVAAVAGGRDQGSAILPDEPEEPLARPAAGAAAPPAAPPTDLLPAAIPPAPVVTPRPATPVATAPRVIASAPVVAPSAPKPEPVTTKPKPDLAKADKPKPAKPRQDDPLAAIARDLDAPSKSKADAPDKPKAVIAAKGGLVTLQLGAFSTRDKADAAWTKAGGDGALSGLTKRIEPVEHDGVTLYRLRAGGVASADAAKALCGRLHAAGAACIVTE